MNAALSQQPQTTPIIFSLNQLCNIIIHTSKIPPMKTLFIQYIVDIIDFNYSYFEPEQSKPLLVKIASNNDRKDSELNKIVVIKRGLL